MVSVCFPMCDLTQADKPIPSAPLPPEASGKFPMLRIQLALNSPYQTVKAELERVFEACGIDLCHVTCLLACGSILTCILLYPSYLCTCTFCSSRFFFVFVFSVLVKCLRYYWRFYARFEREDIGHRNTRRIFAEVYLSL
jgi:hypothetical protein